MAMSVGRPVKEIRWADGMKLSESIAEVRARAGSVWWVMLRRRRESAWWPSEGSNTVTLIGLELGWGWLLLMAKEV